MERLKLALAVLFGRANIVHVDTYGYLVTPTYDHAHDFLVMALAGDEDTHTRTVHIYEGSN